MGTLTLGETSWQSQDLFNAAQQAQTKINITPKSWETIKTKRAHLEQLISQGQTIYGVNTGFGALASVPISSDKLAELQLNIIRSHACGISENLNLEESRGLLLLRAHSLLLGYSGVSQECISAILDLISHDVIPCIPLRGSVGASGDLAPLAHLALALIGEGQVHYQGEVRETAEVFAELKLNKIQPRAKEGLALLNGTLLMSTRAVFALETAKNLIESADIAAALSWLAFQGNPSPFDPRIHALRPHQGQVNTAAKIKALIANQQSNSGRTQDPYSFRCVPQVHGASRDALEYLEKVLAVEIHSTTDNPLLVDEDTILSGGNFHGQYLAIGLDFLGIAIAEIANIAERRIDKLVSSHMSGLPAFLSENHGLNSGFMIPHVSAAALVSENKSLTTPASTDSIPTSAAQEDHVSMGPLAAQQAHQININTSYVLAIELLSACQGIDLLKIEPKEYLREIYFKVRQSIP